MNTRLSSALLPLAICALAFSALPFMLDSYTLTLVNQYMILAFVACAWSVLGGYGNLVSLGHAAFFGLGSYSMAVLGVEMGLPLLLATLVGMASGALLLLLLTWVSVRYAVSGIYFAGLTLVVAEGLRSLFTSLEVAGRSQGLAVFPETILGIPFLPNTTEVFFGVGLVLLVLGVGGLIMLRRGRLGYELMALRDDQEAARSMGVRQPRVVYIAAIVSGGLTALGGALNASLVGFVEPAQEFGLPLSLQLVFATFLGGRSNPWGPAIGMAVYIGGREFAVNTLPSGTLEAPTLVQIMFGLVLLLVVLVAPDGVMGLLSRSGSHVWGRLRPRRAGVLTTKPESATAKGPGFEIATTERPELRTRGLSKHFAGLKAVDEIDMVIRPGEVVGVIGPNGSGKSTLINAITGILEPTAGTVLMGDREIQGSLPETVSGAGVSRTFQIPRPFGSLTVVENCYVPALQKSRSKAEAVQRAVAAAELVGLGDELDVGASDLQLVGLRRLEVARALCAQPGILFLDEAMSGLSVTEQRELVDLLASLNERHGLSMVIVEHVLPIISELCERVLVLDVGKKIAEGSPEEVLRERHVIEAYIGRSLNDG